MPPSRRRQKKSRPRRLIPIIIAVVTCIAVAFFFTSGNYRRVVRSLHRLAVPKRTAHAISADSFLEDTIRVRLHRLDVPDSAVFCKYYPSDSLFEIHAAIPQGEPMAVVLYRLSAPVAGSAYHVDDCFCQAGGQRCEVVFVSSVPGLPTIELTVNRAPRFASSAAEMALVITDIGPADDEIDSELFSLPAPLTIALAPTAAAKLQVKQIAGGGKKEVVLLLPLEPSIKSHDEFRKLRIMIHYPDDKLRSLMHGSMAMVPGFAGFSNFGGTRALEDSRVMSIVFAEMKKRHVYFLEQGITHKSVAASLSDSFALPYATVQGVIDSGGAPRIRVPNRAQSRHAVHAPAVHAPGVQEQLVHYALEARKRGKIIVSAKASDDLLQALRHEIPLFEHSGIKLALVSQLFDTTSEMR